MRRGMEAVIMFYAISAMKVLDSLGSKVLLLLKEKKETFYMKKEKITMNPSLKFS
jgi:hypothetical protein